MEQEQYRYDPAYKKLYMWSDEHQAYLFVCSNPDGLSERELIEEYQLYHCDDVYNENC